MTANVNVFHPFANAMPIEIHDVEVGKVSTDVVPEEMQQKDISCNSYQGRERYALLGNRRFGMYDSIPRERERERERERLID